MIDLWIFYALIPAYVANMLPILARKIPGNYPMDFNLRLRGKRVLGDHKTWKGFFSGVIGGTLAGIVLLQIYWPFSFSAISWSIAVSAGALLGDAAKSFFKRQIGIMPGNPWIPFDEIDFTIGALALGSIVYFPGWETAIAVIVISGVGHVIVNHVSFYLGLRTEKW